MRVLFTKVRTEKDTIKPMDEFYRPLHHTPPLNLQDTASISVIKFFNGQKFKALDFIVQINLLFN